MVAEDLVALKKRFVFSRSLMCPCGKPLGYDPVRARELKGWEAWYCPGWLLGGIDFSAPHTQNLPFSIYGPKERI